MSQINITAAAAAITEGLVLVKVAFNDEDPQDYIYFALESDGIECGDTVLVSSNKPRKRTRYASGPLGQRTLSVKSAVVTEVASASTLDLYSEHKYRFILCKADFETYKERTMALNRTAEKVNQARNTNAQAQAQILQMLGLTSTVPLTLESKTEDIDDEENQTS